VTHLGDDVVKGVRVADGEAREHEVGAGVGDGADTVIAGVAWKQTGEEPYNNYVSNTAQRQQHCRKVFDTYTRAVQYIMRLCS